MIPDNISFEFEVDLGKEYAGVTLATTQGDKKVDENGKLLLSTKPGSTVGVEGIDEGTSVTVTERQVEGSGFAVKDGAVSQQAVIAETVAQIDFTNVYTPGKLDPVNLNVIGSKTLEGRDWQDGDTFEILLEQEGADGNWTPLGTQVIVYDANNPDFNKFDFSSVIQSLEFAEVGTYSFRMSEVEGDLEGMTYDKTVNYFDVSVTDQDMDGKLEIHKVTATENAAVSEADGIYTVAVSFNNTFVPQDTPIPDDITVTIPVNKTVKNTGANQITPEGFEFVLENVDTSELSAVKSDVNGQAAFGLNFTADDVGKTFSYKLSETDDGRTGVTYSTAVYDVQIAIELGADNNLVATMTVGGTAANDFVAEFENIYHVGTTPNPSQPTTGDNSNIQISILIAAISAGLMILLIVFKKREEI